MYDSYVRSGDSMEDFACQWLTQSTELIQGWIPAGATKKPQLFIGGMFPLDKTGAWAEPTLVPG